MEKEEGSLGKNLNSNCAQSATHIQCLPGAHFTRSLVQIIASFLFLFPQSHEVGQRMWIWNYEL